MTSKSSFGNDCQECFGTTNLYEVLRLTDGKNEATKAISQAQIKKAYYKASMKWHPDRFSGDDDAHKSEATRKFQILGRVYSILNDKEKRAVYDETGIIDEENVIGSDDEDWAAKWRTMFKKVTVEDLNKFTREYQGSSEEREDIKRAYMKHEGDMGKIVDDVMAASMDDESRFVDIIKDLIESGEVPDFPKFSKESTTKKNARKRKATKEAKEAEEALKEIKAKSGGGDLAQMIAMRQSARQENMNSFFDQLEAKYSKTGKKNKKKA
uniref:J domain-containing protein n=1 Tax=Plectus sambesii TaxID=2011161 RepID=A0A914W5T6_9BILA